MNGLEGLEDLRAALRGSLLLPGEGPFAKRVSEVWAVSGASPKLTEPAFIVQPRGEPARRRYAASATHFDWRHLLLSFPHTIESAGLQALISSLVREKCGITWSNKFSTQPVTVVFRIPPPLPSLPYIA